MRLWRFAGPNGIYVFPTGGTGGQTSGRDNFGELKPRTTSVGFDNYDELNTRRAPQGIGNVDATWWIFKDTDSSIGPKRDTALSMAGWMKSRLFTRVWDEREGVRWCWARINNIRVNESASAMPHTQQQVNASFQVSDPGWNGSQKKLYCNQGHALNTGLRMGGALYLNDGQTLDSGLRVNPPKLKVQATDGGEYTIRNAGNRPTKSIIRVAAVEREWAFGPAIHLGDGHHFDGGVDPVSSITITMKTRGRIVGIWFWGGTLASGEELIVDGNKQSVTVRGLGGRRDAYNQFARRKGSGFFEIPPGEHTLEFNAGMSARGARLIVNFWDSYFSS